MFALRIALRKSVSSKNLKLGRLAKCSYKRCLTLRETLSEFSVGKEKARHCLVDSRRWRRFQQTYSSSKITNGLEVPPVESERSDVLALCKAMSRSNLSE